MKVVVEVVVVFLALVLPRGQSNRGRTTAVIRVSSEKNSKVGGYYSITAYCNSFTSNTVAGVYCNAVRSRQQYCSSS